MQIKALFFDIGGVLLTNGWDLPARKRAARIFHLDWADMEERHHLTFEAHEQGKITLDQYLSLVVFHRKRPFTRAEFRRFIFAESKPYPEMLELAARLKARHGLKIAVVSNEARDINAHRIRKFRLDRFVDFFVSSCFVQLRKPDAAIFRLALDLAQVAAHQVVYVENTAMFVQVAEGLGIRGILHADYRSTCAKLGAFGIDPGEGGPRRGTSTRNRNEN